MAKTLARIFGVIVLLLGVIGFFSNAFIGSDGYFMANAGLNIVNVILGIVLLGSSATEVGAQIWLKVMGAVYFLLAIIGFAVMTATGTANVLGFMLFNMADNWLYVIVGILMFAAGFATEGRVSPMRTIHVHSHQ